MRIGSAENLTLLLIHRDRFGEGRFLVPPVAVGVAHGDRVDLSHSVAVAPVGEDQPACSHLCDALHATRDTDVPRPAGYGYPELPLNDAAACLGSGDTNAAVGGGAGDAGCAGVGGLLDVFA